VPYWVTTAGDTLFESPKGDDPVSKLAVRIGGVDAEVLYAGAAPGSVRGVLQVNVRLPESVQGVQSVQITIGTATSQPGVSVAFVGEWPPQGRDTVQAQTDAGSPYSCVNLANLLLARATGRQREFAVRRALGATRMRLVRQSFVETIPLASAGAALGVLASNWLLALLIPLLPPAMPRVEEIAIRGPVLLFTTVLCVAAALAISIAPAVQVSASLERGPAGHGRLRPSLIVAEIAGTVVLLVCAGLLIRSFVKVRGTEPGFEPDRVLTLHLAVDRATHGGEDRDVARYLARLVERVQSVSGIQSVGIVNRLPLGGQAQTLTIEFEGAGALINIDSRSVSGLAAGLALSAAVARFIGGILYGVGTLDTIKYSSVALLLLLVVLAASYLPARRASKTDPMIALRHE